MTTADKLRGLMEGEDHRWGVVVHDDGHVVVSTPDAETCRKLIRGMIDGKTGGSFTSRVVCRLTPSPYASKAQCKALGEKIVASVNLLPALAAVVEAARAVDDMAKDWKAYYKLPEDENTDWKAREKMIDELMARSKAASEALPTALSALDAAVAREVG